MNISGPIHNNVHGSDVNHSQSCNNAVTLYRRYAFRSLYPRQSSRDFALKVLTQIAPNRLVKCLSKRKLSTRKPQTSFLELVDNKKFHELISILKDDQYNFKKWIPKNSEIARGQSALHLVLQFHPPVDIIDLLMRRMKQVNKGSCPEMGQDDFGRTPLHVAIARECDASIIERLLCGNNTNSCLRNSAAVMDCHKRYPLHYICSNQCRVQSKNSHSGVDCVNFIQIMKMLVQAYPAAVHSKDKFGWSPFKMAEKLCANEEVFNLFELKITHSTHTADETNTENETETEKFPMNEICFRSNDDQNDDDLSSVGWNISKRFERVRSRKKVPTGKSDAHNVLHLSIHEIQVPPLVHHNELNTQRYRFL